MTLNHSISSIGARLRAILSSIGSTLSPDGGPSVEGPLHWLSEARTRLQGIDVGARTVQAVGAAVVLGTLYVAIWGVGPNLVAHSPDVVAARVAPIGSLTLQEPASPQLAEPTSPANPAANSL